MAGADREYRGDRDPRLRGFQFPPRRRRCDDLSGFVAGSRLGRPQDNCIYFNRLLKPYSDLASVVLTFLALSIILQKCKASRSVQK